MRMSKTGVLPQALPACAVYVMSYAQVVLYERGGQLISPVVIDQYHQIQIRHRVDIPGLK